MQRVAAECGGAPSGQQPPPAPPPWRALPGAPPLVGSRRHAPSSLRSCPVSPALGSPRNYEDDKVKTSKLRFVLLLHVLLAASRGSSTTTSRPPGPACGPISMRICSAP
ncbi:40-kDa huntingtin-associated protein-like [Triticum dicoccoides]|uniref:40-kDa huntingtin-associated protein-like n=1 Tax=Triticum dicoccoides TaxID=85692 RepID=UPI0018918882|nr:40-kDa huntingtin-associated protein-like [Triticum dicoccoides]